jgi:hypothetical protein
MFIGGGLVGSALPRSEFFFVSFGLLIGEYIPVTGVSLGYGGTSDLYEGRID